MSKLITGFTKGEGLKIRPYIILKNSIYQGFIKEGLNQALQMQYSKEFDLSGVYQGVKA
jgi:hypothetical protein